MNFLGHLYFSYDQAELQHANLIGDFIKGSDLKAYPELLRKGILLHREIDSYIDNHPVVRELLHLLYADLPKIAGIAVDMMFDHLLAKDWKSYHAQPLREFVDNFYTSSPKYTPYFPESYTHMLDRMREEDWLFNYSTYEGFKVACERFSSRIPFANKLAEVPNHFLQHESSIHSAFVRFMHDAIPHFDQYAIDQQLQ